ncbi:hypothetical protein ACFOVU_28385 [Nocardiopsis sediminis]|uniref:DUF5668 domain-containing protein n=1 Tax=Nocardiopsis sediminis TaxID=1778267 RepID=A0ABV8FUP0_9ACTN
MSRHKTDWGSLIAGLLFIALGAAFVISGSTDWGFDAVWVLPVLAIGVGTAGVARALAGSRDHDDRA